MSILKPDLLSFLGSSNAMEAVMRFSSRQTLLLFGIIYLLLPNGAFSNNSNMFPRNSAMQPCELSNGKEGLCVFGYLCRNNTINIDGNGIIDLRFLDICEDYMLKCCSKETPCLENTGTCVSATNCGANLNELKYKEFTQTDECDWSDYQCCPNDKIGVKELSNTSELGNSGVISSDDQTNSIEQYETCDDHTICVSDDQCLVKPDGDNIIQPRASICSGMNQTCCPRDKVKGNDPCNEVGGTCIPESSCPAYSSLIMDIRISQCDEFGHVCCMQDATEGRDQFINKTCFGGNGKCTPRKQCKGTTYKDKNKECGGLACCAALSTLPTLPPTIVSTSTTSKPEDNGAEGKACFNGLGQCTSGNCVGIKYKDRRRVCEGLNCCSLDSSTTTASYFSTTTLKYQITSSTPKYEITTTRTTITEGIKGKACYYNQGMCMTNSCPGETYSDTYDECKGLNCCADITTPPTESPPTYSDRSCNSVGGRCMLNQDCHQKSVFSVDDCKYNEVCCVQGPPDELIKNCGYRNEKGAKFNMIGGEDGEAQFGEFPWMVAIMANENGKARFICGGSLIDPEVVLTSAQCVKSYRRSPAKLIVRAGEWDMGTTSEPIPHDERVVAKIKSHPDFKATTLVNNIALLFLEDKFDQGSTINTVCLPPQNFAIDNGAVTASGWGSTPQNRAKYQQILKSFELPYVERSECERALRSGTRYPSFKLHSSFICAGGVAGSDTCTGDAGSPIVYPVPNDFDSRYYAVGMVSWGVGCGKAGIPAAYTDIAFFRTWIDNEMEKEGLQAHYYTYTMHEGGDYQ